MWDRILTQPNPKHLLQYVRSLGHHFTHVFCSNEKKNPPPSLYWELDPIAPQDLDELMKRLGPSEDKVDEDRSNSALDCLASGKRRAAMW